MTARFADVVLPLPLGQSYTYRIPTSLGDRIVAGSRVVVPLRRRELVGLVVSTTDETPPASVHPKNILGAPDAEPALSGPLLETAHWMAGYYGAPIGLSVKAMLPGGMWGSSKVVVKLVGRAAAGGGLAGQVVDFLARKGGEASVTALARHFHQSVWGAVDRLTRIGAVETVVVPPTATRPGTTERVLALAGERLTLLERKDVFGRSPKQRLLYETLEQLGGRAPVAHVRRQLTVSESVVKGLVQRGLARIDVAAAPKDPFAADPGSPPPTQLTAHQTAALEEIDSLEPGEGALLVGVTGSGKTLVYLEAIRRQLEAGRGAIILVPEIGLTPQTVSRVRGVFGDQVAVLHSGLSDGERADAWFSLKSGRRRVAVGARSAVFAPVADLGTIVIDEEHEGSYKNGETPRYHAREVAAVRTKLEGARLLLGSATPSVESAAAIGGRLSRINLPERVGGQSLPPVELVDLRSAGRAKDAGAFPWSARLDDAVTRVIARGEQALLLLNRRGFAAFLQCPGCGHVVTCERCSISLTVHRTPPRLRCHYCDHDQAVPTACGECGSGMQRMRGIGTQQLEHFLTDRFPDARLVRMDLDTTSTKWSHHRILEQVERREVDLLLGTQMIAKGLDFPAVTLVGVIDADTALYLPDFRAAERTFQLVAQVAGRAGRGPGGGRVVVQTYNPEHYALTHAALHDTDGFLADELDIRRSPIYPPHVSLVNFLVSGVDEQEVAGEADRLANWCHALVEARQLPLTVLGPAPAPLAKVKDRWRWHVLLKGAGPEIGRVVRFAADQLPGGKRVRVIIDRDPVSLI